MKKLTPFKLAINLMVFIIIFNGYSRAIAEQSSIEFNVADIALASAQTQNDVKAKLDKAKANGQAALVVITANGTADIEKAVQIANDAKKTHKNAVVVELNRDDESNASYVREWQLARAPLPLIIVVSPSGMATGGLLLHQATPESLVSLIPSPKLDEVYQSLGSGKPVLAVFTSKAFTDRKEVLNICNEASSILNNNVTIIEVDIKDKREKDFMVQMRIDPSTENSITMVINTAGQVSGTAASIPDANKLAEAATNILRGGCGSQFGPSSCGQD